MLSSLAFALLPLSLAPKTPVAIALPHPGGFPGLFGGLLGIELTGIVG